MWQIVAGNDWQRGNEVGRGREESKQEFAVGKINENKKIRKENQAKISEKHVGQMSQKG